MEGGTADYVAAFRTKRPQGGATAPWESTIDPTDRPVTPLKDIYSATASPQQTICCLNAACAVVRCPFVRHVRVFCRNE